MRECFSLMKSCRNSLISSILRTNLNKKIGKRQEQTGGLYLEKYKRKWSFEKGFLILGNYWFSTILKKGALKGQNDLLTKVKKGYGLYNFSF